jgi:hypothetical protein
LSLYQTNHLQALANGENLANGYSYFPDLDPLEVKAEECQWSFESSYDQHSFMPQSYSGLDNVAKEATAAFLLKASLAFSFNLALIVS